MKNKKWILMVATYLLFTKLFSQVAVQETKLFVVVKDGKSGYIDQSGQLVIPCMYDRLYDHQFPSFENGLIGFRQSDGWGVLDATGRVVIPPNYQDKINFNNSGYAAVRLKKVKTDSDDDDLFSGLSDLIDTKKQYTIINMAGEQVLTKTYMLPFLSPGLSDDYVIFKMEDDRTSFINIKTGVECPYSYYYIGGFENGYSVAKWQRGENYGLISETGNWTFSEKYWDLTAPDDFGLIQATLDSGSTDWQLIDVAGTVKAGPFKNYGREYFLGYKLFTKEGLLSVQDMETKLWGYMNTSGELVIPCKYNIPARFYEGIALVSTGGTLKEGYFGIKSVVDGNWKAININGETLFPISNCTDASVFSEGACSVKIGEYWGIIGTDGKFIVDPFLEKRPGFFKNGLSLYESPKGFGYVNLGGYIVWEPSK